MSQHAQVQPSFILHRELKNILMQQCGHIELVERLEDNSEGLQAMIKDSAHQDYGVEC